MDSIAGLHADSWRRHYRGTYSDAFLDGDVFANRLAEWSDRLQEPDASTCTLVAENEFGVVGFAHTRFDQDATWGALLDNLHVTAARKREGVGSRLLALTAREVADRGTGLYLWVLEANVDAQAFYEARGGRRADRAPVSPPGGVAGWLDGSPAMLRYVWPDPSSLTVPA